MKFSSGILFFVFAAGFVAAEPIPNVNAAARAEAAEAQRPPTQICDGQPFQCKTNKDCIEHAKECNLPRDKSKCNKKGFCVKKH